MKKMDILKLFTAQKLECNKMHFNFKTPRSRTMRLLIRHEPYNDFYIDEQSVSRASGEGGIELDI